MAVLTWQREWGPQFERHIKHLRKKGDLEDISKWPKWLAERPELELGEDYFFNAFLELDLERSHAMAVTRIPPSFIRAFCEDIEDREFAEDVFDIIMRLDAAHCAALNEERQKEQGTK